MRHPMHRYLVKETEGNFTADQAVAFLSHWKDPNSPRGPIMIDPETHDIVQNVYIRPRRKAG